MYLICVISYISGSVRNGLAVLVSVLTLCIKIETYIYSPSMKIRIEDFGRPYINKGMTQMLMLISFSSFHSCGSKVLASEITRFYRYYLLDLGTLGYNVGHLYISKFLFLGFIKAVVL